MEINQNIKKMDKINLNDSLDIILIKLDLTISEREEVNFLFDEEDLSNEALKNKLSNILPEDKVEMIINWKELL